jgi:hypothetical protein
VAATLDAAKSNIPPKVTDGRALRGPAQTVVYWSEIAIIHGADLARLARRGIVGGNIAIADNESSAYSTALNLLNGLVGEKGTLTLLDKAAKDPNTKAIDDANKAFDDTRTLLGALVSAAEGVDAILPTSMAQGAVPTIWYSPACSFLRPNTSAGTWWTANNWKSLAFYQISSSTNSATGTLTVNGNGNYRVIAVAAGKAWTDQPLNQNHSTLTVANFLEGINADLSRDGNASSPSPDFIQRPPSAKINDQFNDRLAY